MRSITIITFALILGSTPAFAQGVIGGFAAVTETEAVIEMVLKKGNIAELITGYLPIEPNQAFDPYVRYGRWSQSEGLLTVEIKDLGTLQYKVMDFLPYEEFGHEGGSFGLSPNKTNEEPFNRYGLWRKSDLLKHFKK
jgi:hypothetical protein